MHEYEGSNLEPLCDHDPENAATFRAVMWNPWNRVVQCHRCGEIIWPITWMWVCARPRSVTESQLDWSPRSMLGYEPRMGLER